MGPVIRALTGVPSRDRMGRLVKIDKLTDATPSECMLRCTSPGLMSRGSREGVLIKKLCLGRGHETGIRKT
jgi:hypothetical protein